VSDEPKQVENPFGRPKCRLCDKVSVLLVTDADPSTGKITSLDLCEEHAAEFLWRGNPDRLADPR
jgi:hypothetical protein